MEQATFLPDDPQSLVEASLSCPLCLHATDWRMSGHGSDAEVECRCRVCEHRRAVHLTGPQLLRLTVPDDEADGLIIGPGLEGAWRGLLWDL
ncbi:MAG TPA: hypothetical protein VN238_13330 [Solirubrobacteraceae bacterium]|nr:hypothetical protein [Solirubrobacteraceae bacterium]